jgi:hypothetical protein
MGKIGLESPGASGNESAVTGEGSLWATANRTVKTRTASTRNVVLNLGRGFEVEESGLLAK